MDQAFVAYSKSKGSRRIEVVEEAGARHREECQLRLAKATNAGKKANTSWTSIIK